MYRIVLNETSYYGAGCRSVIADEIRKRGFKKVLLVTDKDLIRFGVAAKIEGPCWAKPCRFALAGVAARC